MLSPPSDYQFFKHLLWYYYRELRKKNMQEKARISGLIVLSVSVLFNIASVMILIAALLPDVADFIDDLIRDIFPENAGRLAGQLPAIVFLGLFFLFLRYTYGKPRKHKAIISSYLMLTEKQQSIYATRGFLYFIISLLALLPCIFLIAYI